MDSEVQGLVKLLVDEINRTQNPSLNASEAIATILFNGTRTKERANELLENAKQRINELYEGKKQ